MSVSLDEPRKVFSVSNKKHCIIDDLPMKILKHCFKTITLIFLRIITTNVLSETVRNNWKREFVISITGISLHVSQF